MKTVKEFGHENLRPGMLIHDQYMSSHVTYILLERNPKNGLWRSFIVETDGWCLKAGTISSRLCVYPDNLVIGTFIE